MTVRSATVCHDGLLFISACHHVPLAAWPPATCALGESQSDTLAGELERGHAVGVSRGKLLAAAVVLSRPEACRSPDLAGTQGASRQAFLVCLEWPSRQAPLAGVLSLPGKILLPGPCLFTLNALFLNGSKGTHGGLWRSSSKPCRAALQLPVHKFGILGYPYSSTPTGAPGPGPYTVPSAVGPGPKQCTGTRGLGHAESNSAPTAHAQNGTRQTRRRGRDRGWRAWG